MHIAPVFGTRLWYGQISLCIINQQCFHAPQPSTWLNSATTEIAMIKTALIDGEYEIPAPLVLQEPDHHKCNLKKVFSLELRQCQWCRWIPRLAIAVARPKLLADSMGSATEMKSVPSICYLHGWWTTLPTCLQANRVQWDRQSEIEVFWQHGNGYLAEGVVLTCSVHTQQPHHIFCIIYTGCIQSVDWTGGLD